MSKRKYKDIRFHGKSLETIERVNAIVAEYEAQGYELTLRQVYYQLVARGFIPNNERSYKNLGSLINDGRLAGLIDWYAIVDRTRNLRRNNHWENPESVIDSARYSYMLDRWKNQPNYVEVWVEKDALIGIVSQICRELDVPHFHVEGTLPSQKCGVPHRDSFDRITEKAAQLFIWETMTRAALI